MSVPPPASPKVASVTWGGSPATWLSKRHVRFAPVEASGAAWIVMRVEPPTGPPRGARLMTAGLAWYAYRATLEWNC